MASEQFTIIIVVQGGGAQILKWFSEVSVCAYV